MLVDHVLASMTVLASHGWCHGAQINCWAQGVAQQKKKMAMMMKPDEVVPESWGREGNRRH